MRIGFCGLGQMGAPMALNLLKSGADLIVSSRRSETRTAFGARGADVTGDHRELAQAEIVFLCLPDGEVVEDLVAGESGLLPSLVPGQTIVDLSTISYRTTLRLAGLAAARKVDFIDAPVSGMKARAIDGTLTVMCGGAADRIARVEPYLNAIGSKILHMGGSGTGQLAKLINQLLFDINAAALAEILPMAARMGLDPRKTADVINSGTGKSYASEFFVPRILQDDFSGGYPMKHAYKDLVSAAEIGANLCVPLPVLAAATHTYQAALLKGYGDLDKGGMIRVFEDLLDVRFRAAAGAVVAAGGT